MLRKGISLIIRSEDERKCFIQAANKLGYLGRGGSSPVSIARLDVPFAISIDNVSTDRCMGSGKNLTFTNYGKLEIVEASELFLNQLISLRKAKARCGESI